MRNKKKIAFFTILILALIFTFGTVTAIGVAEISYRDTYRIIASRLPFLSNVIDANWAQGHEAIIMNLRLPRTLLSIMVGAALSMAGTTYQGLLRNPLADPFTIGVSSGAAVGASLYLLIQEQELLAGLFRTLPELIGLPGFSFAGGILALAIVYSLARVGGRVPPVTLLLAGVVVSSFLSAVISFIMIISGESMQGIFFWISGGFNLAGWQHVTILFPYLLAGGIVIYFFARDLNIILLGEESATYLGIPVEQVKKILLVTASLLTAACVSVSGMIGFVGLIVPHAARLILGPDHRLLLPGALLLGGIVLAWMDVLARTMLSPAEIPVGVVTAFVGAPFFLILLKQKRDEFYF
ncbi:FecCD family ABC transporter permease [Natranaerobius thermophilus]|uniref:Transport system permease protein n=1 Tax=Natranaerobius thermophilus (strain ATCC BAA-1301 / DSM 18059 / JW/NM-WN-LF) TaxID=457570 RepID=B2A0Q1_NATTJ|nr:iron chelate uptake ABC transporter family permease subunit [Natranaerobius thermophilus]ACB85931.1 transport system permease protein [Natranaerobius thermophilus JW/NM-WN-LF]